VILKSLIAGNVAPVKDKLYLLKKRFNGALNSYHGNDAVSTPLIGRRCGCFY